MKVNLEKFLKGLKKANSLEAIALLKDLYQHGFEEGQLHCKKACLYAISVVDGIYTGHNDSPTYMPFKLSVEENINISQPVIEDKCCGLYKFKLEN